MNTVISPTGRPSAHSSVEFNIRFADELLADPSVTEIAVNKQGELWGYSDMWRSYDSAVTDIDLEGLANSLTSYNQDIGKPPIMTQTLHTGERIHMTRMPVTKNFTVTIRKPSSGVITMDQYEAAGFFDIQPKSATDTLLDELHAAGKFREFLTLAVEVGKTIVISGSTGSGKTSFLRALMQYIPANARVITGEDVSEIFCTHANHVAMFFKITAKPGEKVVTPDDVLRSALRMLPSRIIYGELRGPEALTWMQACNSGHGGSMVTIHANTGETIERLCDLAMQSPVMMPYGAIEAMARKVAQVIVHIEKDERTGTRHLTEVTYNSSFGVQTA